MPRKKLEVKTEEVKTEQVIASEPVASVDPMAQINADIQKVSNEGLKVRRPQPVSTAATQLHYFASQPSVRYRLPRAAGERAGSFETVIVNDLMITIMKGVNCNMPEDVAKYLDDSLSITDNALNNAALKNIPAELQ